MNRLPFPLLPAWLRWTLVIALVAFVFYVSIITAPPETPIDTRPDLIPLDKWRHFLAYAAIGGSLAYATTNWHGSQRALALGVFTVTVVYGVGIEYWQSFLPNRYFSLGDAYANAIGGVLALVWYVIRPRLEFRPISALIR